MDRRQQRLPHRPILIPKRNWMQRNPRAFVIIGTVSLLTVMFSRPLYDIFLRPDNEFLPPPPGPMKPRN